MDLDKKTEQAVNVTSWVFSFFVISVILILMWALYPQKSTVETKVIEPVIPPSVPALFPIEYGWQLAGNNGEHVPWMAIVKLPTGERVLVAIKVFSTSASISTLLLPPLPQSVIEQK